MAHYRLFYLKDGGLPDLDEVEARDDAEAAELAKARAHPGPVEIWHGGRRVRTVAPRSREPARQGD
jgi:hypothetical protein